jgi:hypothetical protein
MRPTLLFLLLASISVQGQTKGKVSGKIELSSSSSGPVYIGFNEGQASVMMNLKDSTFMVGGKDSLAAIKMMYKRIHENSKMYEKQILWLHRHIDKQEKIIKQLQQYIKDRDKIDQELSLKKVKKQ